MLVQLPQEGGVAEWSRHWNQEAAGSNPCTDLLLSFSLVSGWKATFIYLFTEGLYIAPSTAQGHPRAVHWFKPYTSQITSTSLREISPIPLDSFGA